jgi:tetratricopeptide (TPR) repeat protein
MSVINKMLRDLDSRRSQAVLAERRATPELLRGTASVGGLAVQGRRWRVLVLAALGLGLLAVLVWLRWLQPATQGKASSANVPVSAPAAVDTAAQASPSLVPPASAPVAATAALPPVQQIMEAAAQAAAQRAQSSAAARRSTDGAAPRKERGHAAPGEASAAEATPRPRRAASTAQQAPALASAAPQASPAAAGTAMAEATTSSPQAAPSAAAATQRRASAVQEGLAQAQVLWTGGSREAAVELLRDTLAGAERAGVGDVEIQALARELARMELVQGRVGQALELLTRLEPRLASQADLWALRGNAAQRLGRHGEAVQAYERALQLRPGETRWLLGAAVSLAVLGQLESAARYVEQARAAGPVNPEVLNYLRQAGVAVP